MRPRRPSSARPPGTKRWDSGPSTSAPCSTKYKPRPSLQRNELPPQGVDGGARVIFGRNTALVYPPSNWLPEQAQLKPLNCRLQREYVYGYNGACKASVHMIGDTECVYPVACLVVVLDFVQNRQRYFEGHTNDVTCVAWHETRRLCASGQSDPKGGDGPCVCIWAPRTPSQTISILAHPPGSRWVSAVAFSPDGQTVVSFTCDDAYSYFIWRDFAKWDGTVAPPRRDRDAPVDRVSPLYSASSGRQPTTSIFMCPGFNNQDSIMFYTVGDAPLSKGRGVLGGLFSTWLIGLNLGIGDPAVSHKRGIFGKCAVPRNPMYIAPAPDRGTAWMVGDNGHFYMLCGSKATRNIRVTPPGLDVPLGCVAALPDGRWLAGGADGALYLGRVTPAPVVEERLVFGEELGGAEAQLFRSTATPRFASVAVRGHLVLLGTSNHALMLVDLRTREVVRVLQVSHSDEAWALDFHPTLSILATASIARDVRFWNVADRRPAVGKILRIEQKVWSLAFSPNGSLLALGCDQGYIEVFAFPSLQPVYRESVSRAQERVGDVRFSPDGSMLAAACWDQVVYLLRVTGPVAESGLPVIKVHRALTGNSSSPLHVMFSAAGDILMSNSRDTQILYWRTKDGARETTTSAFRDTRWQAPWTCVLGWPVTGVWGDDDYDGTDVKSVCQSQPPEDGYFAVGDDRGQVKLLRFPSPFISPPCQVCTGHASMVTRVRFSGTNVLATLGGDDHSIMQWSLERIVGAREAAAPVRVVHPWTQLDPEDADMAAGRYDYMGRPLVQQGGHAAAPPPVPPSMAMPPQPTGYGGRPDAWGAAAAASGAPEAAPDPWAELAAASRVGFPREQQQAAGVASSGRLRATSVGPVVRGEAPLPAGAAVGADRLSRRSFAGGRLATSNQSHGVGQALTWGA